MSLLSKFQYIFGFGGYDDDDEQLPDESQSAETAINQKVPNPVDNDTPLEVSNEMVLKIFDKVVEVTNASVPAYFASSLNPEKQKKYLFDALDASTKQYLLSLETLAQNKCMALWQTERDELKREMDNQKQRARELEAKRVEINNQKLSSERQKSALAQRVHDLESSIIKLEAEKEQLEIENRSLINKAKVVNVYEADMENMRQQINDLKAKPADQPNDEEVKLLKDKIAELNSEITRLTEACEAAKMKDEMGDAMLNDLQRRNAESLKNKQELNKKVEDLTSELSLRDAKIADLNVQLSLRDSQIATLDSQVASLGKDISELKNEIAEKDAKIQEDEEALEAVEQIAEQIDRFEDIKTKLDDKILMLKQELKDVKHDNDTLKLTIKNNLYAHAQQEQALRDEIESLRRLTN